MDNLEKKLLQKGFHKFKKSLKADPLEIPLMASLSLGFYKGYNDVSNILVNNNYIFSSLGGFLALDSGLLYFHPVIKNQDGKRDLKKYGIQVFLGSFSIPICFGIGYELGYITSKSDYLTNFLFN